MPSDTEFLGKFANTCNSVFDRLKRIPQNGGRKVANGYKKIEMVNYLRFLRFLSVSLAVVFFWGCVHFPEFHHMPIKKFIGLLACYKIIGAIIQLKFTIT